MKKTALDGNREFPWDKLIRDEGELRVHVEDSIRVGAFVMRCIGCGKWRLDIEDGMCNSCWEKVQRAIE